LGTARRAGLDRDEVVDHALALVESDGAAALTMRNLAARIGITTTTIYWHVGGRDELVIAVIERAAQRNAEITIEGVTARARVTSVAHTVWSTAIANRNVTSLAHQTGSTGVLEHHLELAMARELEAGGLTGVEVRDALRAIFMVVAGFLVVAFKADDRRTDATAAKDMLSPATVLALAEPPDLPALFTATLQAVVNSFVPPGPARRSSHPKKSSARAKGSPRTNENARTKEKK